MIKHFHKLTHSDPYAHAEKACKSLGFYLFFQGPNFIFLNRQPEFLILKKHNGPKKHEEIKPQ